MRVMDSMSSNTTPRRLLGRYRFTMRPIPPPTFTLPLRLRTLAHGVDRPSSLDLQFDSLLDPEDYDSCT